MDYQFYILGFVEDDPMKEKEGAYFWVCVFFFAGLAWAVLAGLFGGG
jgi:hypothetical protein